MLSPTDSLVLKNDRLRVEFDPQTGALRHVSCPSVAWTVFQREKLAQSFRLVIPLPDRLLNIFDGSKQHLSSAEMDQDGRCLRLTWNGVQSEHGGWMDIILRAVVQLTTSGLSFDLEIENHAQYPVESCAYPYLGELCPPSTSHTLTRANISYDNLIQKPLYPQFSNERGYWGTEFPIQMAATPETPFVLVLANGSETASAHGIYIGCHDTTTAERVEFTFRLLPGYGKVGFVPEEEDIAGQPVHIECYAEHLSFIQPGESKKLLPVVMQPFTGDWHAGVEEYKTWRATWMRRPDLPDWVRQVHAWQQIQMTSWGDTLNLRYEDLPDYTRDCNANGVFAIQLVGWTLYGQDGRLPIHDSDPRLGSREDLKNAIQQMQAQGVRVILYEKYTCADIGTAIYKETVEPLASRDIFGNPHAHEGWRYDTPAHLSGVNIRPYVWMCMNSSAWQDLALAEIEKSLELQPNGILLDESMWHGTNGFYCFDSSHGHSIPAYNFHGDAKFEAKLCGLLDRINPELLLAGEGPYDLQNCSYGLSYHRAGEGHIPVIRYIDPYLPMMNWVIGHDDREGINRCLLYRYIISYEPRHFRGRLSEFPKTLAYGVMVDNLRRKYKEYLWDAEYCDTLGASVLVHDKPHPLFTVFRQPETNQRAVVVVNHNAEEIVARIVLDGTGTDLYWVSPELPEPTATTGQVTIPSRSVVVVLEAPPAIL